MKTDWNIRKVPALATLSKEQRSRVVEAACWKGFLHWLTLAGLVTGCLLCATSRELFLMNPHVPSWIWAAVAGTASVSIIVVTHRLACVRILRKQLSKPWKPSFERAL